LTSLELMTEEVQVWVASLDVSDDRYEALARVLPAEEKERAMTLTPIAARRFMVARGILRNLLLGFRRRSYDLRTVVPESRCWSDTTASNSIFRTLPILGFSRLRQIVRSASM